MGWWKSKVANQMLSCFCIFRNNIITPSWIMAPLALMLLFSSYKLVGFMFFPLLFTSLAVLLSTFLYLWKHKAVPGEGNGLSLSTTSEEKKKITHGRESIANIAPTSMHKNEKTVIQAKESQEQVSDDETAPSESACQQGLPLSTFDDYEEEEVDHNHNHTPEDSDGTISDEDSLIEIALPSGHFVGHIHHKEESNSSKYNNCSLQQKKRELSAETLFNQQSLMEFLAEFNDMNEEENLIEIDIAMGSIKCSRFEIEA